MEDSDSENEKEERILPARTVYLLMKKDYRISRNIRASWFFSHLSKTLKYSPKTCLDENDQELTVIAVTPEAEDTSNDELTPLETDDGFNFKLVPSTVLNFIAKRYRLVFVLDFSHSSLSVDLKTGEVLADKIFLTLKRSLSGLVRPFLLPGTNIRFTTELYITVIAHTPILACTTNQVLMQGIRVDEEKLDKVLSMIQAGLKSFEQSLAMDISKTEETTLSEESDSNADIQETSQSKINDQLVNPEAGIINLLRQGYFALQLLPENSSAGIVVVTDGVLGVTDVNLFDTVMTQLRNSTIACSFLKIGQTYCARCQFGHVPHVELLQFIATATFGAYISSCPDVTTNMSSYQMNLYHKALLMWSFQKGLEGFKFELTHYRYTEPMHPSALSNRVFAHPIKGRPCVMPTIRKKHLETKLNTTISSVLSVRLREGYTIKDIYLTKGETQLEVHLILPWREYAKLEYCAIAAWPLDPSKRQTHVEITIDGSYDFLHDTFSNECTPQQRRWSSIRINSVKKFLIALQRLCQTDQLLVHLQAFGTNPVHYKLTDSIKNGLSVFYIPPNSNNPVLNLQHNAKDAALNQFASFWKPVVNLDIKIWQKWMHCHRIAVVLEHDTPLPKYLHIPNSSGRYSIILCRQSVTALHDLLQNWATFVLIDNAAYVRFLPDDSDKCPDSFLLLRLTSKPPCMVIRTAFLGGTPGEVRHQVLKDLKRRVLSLKFPQRGGPQKSVKGNKAVRDKVKKIVQKPPLQMERSEVSCCILLTKPVEHILISYERKPRDMTILEDPSRYIPSHVNQQQLATKSTFANAFNTLSRYLHHQRWIWTVKQGQVDISMQAVGRILSALTKIRIQEGFHFASSNSGIVNMVLEVDMMHGDIGSDNKEKADSGPCVVQYIVFPPHVKTTRDSVSEEDMDELETTEADGELQIVTECWIEPQYGVAINNSPERQHWNGLSYKEIAKALYPKDLECVSCLVTFEHLLYVCQNNALFVDLPWHLDGSLCSDPDSMCPYKDDGHKDKTTPPNIHQMAFPFDLLSLLPKCQQGELQFSSFILPSSNSDEIHRDSKGANSLLLQLLHKNLRESSEKELSLTKRESRNFLMLLKQRKRDELENPFPFPINEIINDVDNSELGTADSSVEQQTASPAQQKPGQTDSPGVVPGNTDSKNEERVAMWQCFVQSVGNNRMIFTLIPASFDDLLILNNEVPEEKVSRSSAKPETSSTTDNAEIIDQESFVQGLESDLTSPEVDQDRVTNPENLETEDDSTVKSKTCHIIPVYMYDCFLYNVVDSLVNPWNFELQGDIFEDLTFDTNKESDDTCQIRSPLLKRFSLDVSDIREDKEEIYTPAPIMRLSQERRSTENSETDFRQQCNNLCEIYYRCFVYGVFQSLQQGFYIDRLNIDAAINNICEETLPLEIDITTFLHASCRHFQELVASVKSLQTTDTKIMATEEDLKVPKRTSVRFLDLDDSDGESTGGSVPMVLQLPQGKVKLELSQGDACEYFEGLHNVIKNKFMDIVQKWFKVVPSYPDFYFYCPESVPLDNSTDDSDEANISDLSESKQESLSHEDTFEDSTVFQDPEEDYSYLEKKTEFLDKKSNNPDLASIASQLDSESSFDGSDYDLCDDLLNSGEKDGTPMFLHFTCTIKSRLQHENVSVQKLVPCLEEITSSIDHVLELHLGDLKITFDLNCLTYPNDDDISGLRKPSFVRMFSNNSVGCQSPPPPGTEEEKTEVDGSTEPGLSSVIFGDHIGHLPNQQHEAVLKCKEELEWLLRDEIASSLLHLNPIKRDALHFVIDHIKQSSAVGKPACSCEKIPLHFVYGAEHSLTKFREEFERQHLHGFRLIQEDNFYYAVRTKVLNHSHVNTHAKALNDALEVLSREGTPSRASVSSLNQGVDFSIMSSEAGELTTYVSPDLFCPGLQKVRGRNASGSPDISGNEDSPNFIFFREASQKQGRSLFEKRMARKESGTSDSGSKEKTDDSRRGSKEYEHGQKGAYVTPHELNLNTTSAIKIATDRKTRANIEERSPEKVLGKPPLQPSKSSEPRNQGIEEGTDEGSLKKSSSFAGFHNGSQVADTVARQESMVDLFSTPVKQVKGMPQLPSLGRLRHSSAPSGQGTPRSKTSTVPQTPSLISSRGSFTDIGYDGDSSASEEGTTALSDMSGLHHPTPKFWLIMQVHKDSVEVFYHSRKSKRGRGRHSSGIEETGQEENNDLLEHRKLLNDVKKSIEDLCRKVNQLLLLNDLYETRMCKNLLVPEADEDVSWNVDRTFMPGKPASLQSDEDEEEAFPEQQYLACENKLLPGYFECVCVMTHQFIVHPRLKTGTGRSTASRGVQALRGVLNKFSVNNRINMFVIKETAGSQNVFYIRLKEINVSALSRQVSSISTEDMGLCDSASSLMFAAKKEELAHQTPDKEPDTISMTSVGSSSTLRLQQDMVEIHVHGIQPAGPEIQNDLMQLLQNRLDDAVLDFISLQLIRNPMSKLAPEDVHFIQRPNEEAKMTFHQTIPSQVNMHLSALMYYLRQNLLQFSHSPNYSDSKPSSHFQSKDNNKLQAMPEDKVFLYIRPHSSGRKGIACVNVSLVDGLDNPVQMLFCHKPSRTGYTQVENLQNFDSFIKSEIYSRSSSSKPGPTALVRFRIWERGSADLNTLKEKLICALKHALCDIVTEFNFLTASLCAIPHKLQELLPSPVISAPSSPANFRDHERRPSQLSRKNSIDSMKVFSTSKPVDKPFTPSPLQYVKDAFSSRTRLMSPPPDTTKTFDIPASASQVASPCGSMSPGQRSDHPHDIQQIIRLYEEGERGSLHTVFKQKILEWFNFCHKSGVPSVSKTELKFTSKYSLDYFMKEVLTSANSICGDIFPKIFKLQCDADGNIINGTQYNPARHQLQAAESKAETSLDFDRSCISERNEETTFTVIGRNVDQWQASIQDFSEDDILDNTIKSQNQKAIPKQSYQRFPPYLSERSPDKDSDKLTDPYSSIQKPDLVFIPRQRLILLYLRNQNLTMFTYNWAGDLSTLLTKSVNRLVQWQNARICLLNSIISQKMGLFCHTPFIPYNRKKNPNQYISLTTDLDHLIKLQAPPSDQHRRHNSMTTVFSQSRSCDEAYKDLQPTHPLQQTIMNKYSDPVKKHGSQSQDMRLYNKRDVEKLQKLNKHFWMCMEKSAVNMPISDDVIQLLKKSSRLLHYCATPLLLDPQWRLKVMEKYRVTRRQTSNTSVMDKSESKVRSRHSSGTSTSSQRGRRADSQEGKKRPSITPTDSPVNDPRLRFQREELWHVELRHTFEHQYIQYVQSLGFVSVNLRPTTPKRSSYLKKSNEKVSYQEEEGSQATPSGITYLQKTLKAGIMLMELSFREQYFCVKLFVCENTRLGVSVNKALKLLFVDECEKCKDLIHVHSFAHDFHLRCMQSCIQNHISNSPSLFKANYHLTGFLSDFMQVYPYPPKFSRNFLYEDFLTIPELSSTGQHLFDFMLQHDKLYDLKKFTMLPTVDPDIDGDFFFIKNNEFALIQHKDVNGQPPPAGSKQKKEDYCVSLVITHDSQQVNFQSEAERNTLKLQYFIIITSKMEFFPKVTSEKKSLEFKSLVLQELADRTKTVPVKQHISVRKESQKYHRIPNIHHTSPAYILLMQEAIIAKQKMHKMVEISMAKCRNDSLWNRLFMGSKADEDIKRKRRSETEESKDGLQKLTLEEFSELLHMAVKESIDEIDYQLTPFLNLHPQWYKGLHKKLQSKYPETHRSFSSQDGNVQYTVILNGNYLDMFTMLMTDSKENRVQLSAVFREPIQDQMDTAENPSLPIRSVQSHVEDFVNICCFQLWASML